MVKQQNQNPLISILLPYYNDKKFLRKAIDAILASTYENFELILVNHATKDDCREIARNYKDERIRHIDMPYNYGYTGGGPIMSAFLQKAKGKYVKFICADDIIKKNGLETLVNYMENNPLVDFAFGNVEYVDEKGQDLKDSWFKARERFSINNDEADCIRTYFDSFSFLPYIGSIVKRDILELNTLNKTFVMMFDVSLWLDLLCRDFKIGFCDKIVGYYRIHEGQASSVKKETIAGRLCYYEWGAIWQQFLRIKSVELVKKVWPNGVFVKKLQDKRDIPFVVAYEFYKQDKIWWIKPAAMSFIHDLLNDDENRERIEKNFGYGIPQLRQDCAGESEDNDGQYTNNCQTTSKRKKFRPIKNFKRSIFQKNAKLLNYGEILFLLVLRTLDILSLRLWRKKRKEPKRYSL